MSLTLRLGLTVIGCCVVIQPAMSHEDTPRAEAIPHIEVSAEEANIAGAPVAVLDETSGGGAAGMLVEPVQVEDGPANPLLNTHCHKVVYVGGTPYLVRC